MALPLSIAVKPRLSAIRHPYLTGPGWTNLAGTLDYMFENNPDITGVSFEPYCRNEYHDNDVLIRLGYAAFTTTKEGASQPLNDAELDWRLGIREVERRAVDIWEFLPIEANSDNEFVRCADTLTFEVTRTSVFFTKGGSEDGDEPEVRLDFAADFNGSTWQNTARYIVDSDEFSLCISDLLADPDQALIDVASQHGFSIPNGARAKRAATASEVDDAFADYEILLDMEVAPSAARGLNGA